MRLHIIKPSQPSFMSSDYPDHYQPPPTDCKASFQPNLCQFPQVSFPSTKKSQTPRPAATPQPLTPISSSTTCHQPSLPPLLLLPSLSLPLLYSPPSLTLLSDPRPYYLSFHKALKYIKTHPKSAVNSLATAVPHHRPFFTFLLFLQASFWG